MAITFFKDIPNFTCICVYISKSTWGEQPVEDILNFTCICVYLFVYLCHVSWPNEKRYRPEMLYTYSHRPYLKKRFLFFRKKWPWGPLASKNCHVTWIFRISPQMPCSLFKSNPCRYNNRNISAHRLSLLLMLESIVKESTQHVY